MSNKPTANHTNKLISNYLWRCVFILALLLFSSRPLISQTDSLYENLLNLSLEDLLKIKVKVSSTKSSSVFETPSTVTVIDKEMINMYNFENLEEALSVVAGIDVYQTIIDRDIPTARGILQNFYANKVLILINNIPTWQPIYGDGHINRININDVEQIEVLKGPASVLYGSNAYSAVINIVLKKANKNGVTAHATMGFPQNQASGINFKYKKEDLSIVSSINTGIENRKPYKLSNARGFEYNGDSVFNYSEKYAASNFNLNVNYKSHNLFYNGFLFNHSFMGIYPSYIGGGGGSVQNLGHLVNYRFDKQIKKIHLLSNIGYDYFQRSFPVSADRVTQIELKADRSFADIKFNYNIKSYLNLELGSAAEHRRSYGHDTRDALMDTLISHNLINDKPVFEWSAFSQLSLNTKWLNVIAGIRHTNNVYFGSNTSSRVSALLKINERNSFKLIFGESFRVPTMFELYFNHPTVIGNINLEPETSVSYEAAYLSGFKKFYFQILGYYGIYRNLIQRITPETGPPVYQNANSFEGYGTEVELKYLNSKVLNFFINYNYISGVGDNAKSNYQYVPESTISAGINIPIKAFSVSMHSKYLSKVQGYLADIEAQYKFDVNLNYTHKIQNVNLRHSLEFNNITNSDMLTPEYIRKTPNINAIPTTAFGRRIIYSIVLDF